MNVIVGSQKQRLDIKVALSNSFGFGGHNSSVLFAPYEESNEVWSLCLQVTVSSQRFISFSSFPSTNPCKKEKDTTCPYPRLPCLLWVVAFWKGCAKVRIARVNALSFCLLVTKMYCDCDEASSCFACWWPKCIAIVMKPLHVLLALSILVACVMVCTSGKFASKIGSMVSQIWRAKRLASSQRSCSIGIVTLAWSPLSCLEIITCSELGLLVLGNALRVGVFLKEWAPEARGQGPPGISGTPWPEGVAWCKARLFKTWKIHNWDIMKLQNLQWK